MDHDIEDLLQTLDVALTSDNPMVKKALKKFLFIVKMTEHEANEEKLGPYATLLGELQCINRRLDQLESRINSPWATGTYPGYPGGTYKWQGGTATSGTVTTTGSTGGASTSATDWLLGTSPYYTYTISPDQSDFYKYIETMISTDETEDK